MKVLKYLPRFLTGALLLAVFLGLVSEASALTAGQTYTVILSKISNSSGAISQVSTATAVADSNGKIAFAFSSVPNSPETYFLMITIKDSNGTVVREGLAAAPAAGSTNQLGVNELTDVQAELLKKSLLAAGTADPIYVAFGLLLVRSPNILTADINKIAAGGKNAILGTNQANPTDGFVGFLKQNGITDSQLNMMRQKLIFNDASDTRDLSDYIAKFKSAVDAANDTTASQEMAEAGGFMADIFMDAGNAASIDPALIMAAHDAAGQVAENDADMSTLSAGFKDSIGQAMRSFFMRIAIMRIKAEYASALTILGASGDQVTRYNNALTQLISTMEAIDAQYSMYFEDPAANPMTPGVQNAIDTAFQNAFSTFIAAIRVTNAEATAMRTSVVNGLATYMATSTAVIEPFVPANMGRDWRDFDGNTVNWPIPMSVAFNKVGVYLQAGGNFTYNRAPIMAAYAVPGNMAQWMDSRDNPLAPGFPNGKRHDFADFGPAGPQNDLGNEAGANNVAGDDNAIPSPLAALMAMQEDVKVLDMRRFFIWDPAGPYGGNPTRENEKDAGLAFQQGLAAISAQLAANDGSGAVGAEALKAFVKMMQEPTIF